jgi:hypothetical protein
MQTYALAGPRRDSLLLNIERFHKLTVKTYISAPRLSMTISDKSKLGETIHYLPNVMNSMGLDLSWHWLGASYGVRLPRRDINEVLFGKTNYYDYQFYLYLRRFGFDAYWQTYKGFYLDNPKTFDITWRDTLPHPTRGDLSMNNLGLNIFYIHSPKFSFKATYNQTERQKKSAGTFVFMLAQSYEEVSSDTSLVPSNQRVYYEDIDEMNNSRFYNISIAPGYAYSFIWKNLFVTPTLFAGAGYQSQDCSFTTGDLNKTTITPKVNLRFGIGYNGRRFLIGVHGVYDMSYMNVLDSGLRFVMSTLKFQMGLRL